MGLDYWSGCVNFRDVGEWLEAISGEVLLARNVLLRGGRTDFVTDARHIGQPRVIINLRGGPDTQTFGAQYFHVPAENRLEKYRTHEREVRAWLNRVVGAVAQARGTPILVHCTSGKDRTGIVVGALLSILGIPRGTILEEYLLSDGDVQRAWLEGALDGLGDLERYFDRVDLGAVRRVLRRPRLGGAGSGQPTSSVPERG